jgi:hypothetical protein
MSDFIYRRWASTYRDLGLEPRPITPGTKACNIKGWQRPDAEILETERMSWEESYGNFGIGLRLGTRLAAGGFLIAVDVDNDGFCPPIEALLGSTSAGRKGARGAAYFVRTMSDIKPHKISAYNGDPAVDILGIASLVVIPPTIHPTTQMPYTWLGTPLHELSFDQLPVLEV